MAATDDRVTAIEIALAHAEATIEDIGSVVHVQAERIDRLEHALMHLAERLATAEADARPAAASEAPPPHY